MTRRKSSDARQSTSHRLNVVVRSPPLYPRGGPKWRDSYHEGPDHPVAPNRLESFSSFLVFQTKNNSTMSNEHHLHLVNYRSLKLPFGGSTCLSNNTTTRTIAVRSLLLYLTSVPSAVITVFYSKFVTLNEKNRHYKSKLELKSNSSETLPVNCKFICDSTPA